MVLSTRCCRWIFWSALSTTWALVGCQGGPRTQAYVEMVNAERRGLEDRVYALEYELEILEDQLDSFRSENDRLRQELGDDAPARPNTLPPPRSPRRSPDQGRPPARSGTPRPGGRIDTSPPVIEFGDPDESGPPATSPPMAPPKDGTPNSEVPRRISTPATLEPEELPDQASLEELIPLAAPPPASRSQVVRAETPADEPTPEEPDTEAYLTLDATITGGADFDNQPGDDGISLGLTIRDNQGHARPLDGSLSAVLLDPAEQGPAARVARWDLNAPQLARLLRGQSPEAVTLHLAWPDAPPRHERLKLFVRYHTADGRRLEVHRDITVRPSRGSTSSPRVSRRPDPPASSTSVASSEASSAPTPNVPRSALAPAASGNAVRASDEVLPGDGWRPKTGSRVVPASAQEPSPR